MKQQRLKLINRIMDDAEQFGKKKADMVKELLQLKSKVSVHLNYYLPQRESGDDLIKVCHCL